MDRWLSLPKSLRACVSIVKMNIWPRINLISSVIPVSPAVNYWNKIHSSVSRFIWNRKWPHLKLRPLLVWHDWYLSFLTQANCVRPWNLQEVLFANISNKQCRIHFSPTVSQLIQTWRAAELQYKISCKWYTLTPIFTNHGLLIGGRPISCSTWSNSNIRTFDEVYSDTGLSTFQDIRDRYNLPANSFFSICNLDHLYRCMVLRDTNHHLFTHCTNYLPLELKREVEFPLFIIGGLQEEMINYHLTEYGGMISPIWNLTLIGHRSGQILERLPSTPTTNRSTLTMYTEHIWPLANAIVWSW